jgi:hypothetical protein
MTLEPGSEILKRALSSASPAAPAAEDFVRWPLSATRKFKAPAIVEQDYDPRPQEDQARRNIAYCLIALLFFICLSSFKTIWCTNIPVEDVMKIVQILLGPVIALVSAATGFYDGTKSKT